ncbi:unnamed protein product [Orchesella dallaii]|uniref:Enhancer of polycomb-like protein n=1 Tax=Orchesella dallaii TaxID=48710 RepID=A0ABP1QJT2_9HEXA
MAEDIPDTEDCSLTNRAISQVPTGVEKAEALEHHLQLAICSDALIPTPEVCEIEEFAHYGDLYPPSFMMPRQLMRTQPFSMEAGISDYDMDSEDEAWVTSQASRLELTPYKFEAVMDRLEKASTHTVVVTLQEAKAQIKEDDDLIIAVYDYWLNKRLKTQHPLIPQVQTEARHGVTNHHPYIAFRRRPEKMQTRQSHKNKESSYETMLKLKRNLAGVLSHLETVKKCEKSKQERLNFSIEGFEKRYQKGKEQPAAKSSKKTAPAKKAAKGGASSAGRKSAPKKVEESDDDDEEYEVEMVLDMRERKGGREFLIKWKGYSKAKATWEPEDNLSCDDLIKQFEEKAQEKKDQPTRNLRAEPKETDRYVDTADLEHEGRRRSSNRLGKYPRYFTRT